MTIEKIAKMVHEVNRAYCQATGDNSQVSWEDAPKWQKDSAIAGVQYVLDNPDSTPKETHNSWLKLKKEEGWQYGEVKDPELKLHPCFYEYEELPEQQKVKDYLFLAVVKNYIQGDK